MDTTESAIPVPQGAFADKSEFDSWVLNTRMGLIRFCRQIVGDWAEAEDMAQEAYLRAWEKRASFRGECSLLTWQMAIARRVCLDCVRRRKRIEFLPLDNSRPAPGTDQDDGTDVKRALESIGPDDRAILYLRIERGLPFEDIGRVLKCGTAACRKRFERAKKRFETAYGGKEEL